MGKWEKKKKEFSLLADALWNATATPWMELAGRWWWIIQKKKKKKKKSRVELVTVRDKFVVVAFFWSFPHNSDNDNKGVENNNASGSLVLAHPSFLTLASAYKMTKIVLNDSVVTTMTRCCNNTWITWRSTIRTLVAVGGQTIDGIFATTMESLNENSNTQMCSSGRGGGWLFFIEGLDAQQQLVLL